MSTGLKDINLHQLEDIGINKSMYLRYLLGITCFIENNKNFNCFIKPRS